MTRRPDLLTRAVAASRLGVPQRQVMTWLRRGELAGIIYSRARNGRVTRVAFDPRDIEAFIKNHRMEPK